MFHCRNRGTNSGGMPFEYPSSTKMRTPAIRSSLHLKPTSGRWRRQCETSVFSPLCAIAVTTSCPALSRRQRSGLPSHPASSPVTDFKLYFARVSNSLPALPSSPPAPDCILSSAVPLLARRHVNQRWTFAGFNRRKLENRFSSHPARVTAGFGFQ